MRHLNGSKAIALRAAALRTALAFVAAGTLAACGGEQPAAEAPAAEAPAGAAAWQEFTFDDLKLAKRFPVEPTRTEGTYWAWPHTDREPEVVMEGPATFLTATADNIQYDVTVAPRPERMNMGASMMGECAYLTEESGVEQRNLGAQIDNGNRTVYGHQVTVDLHDMSGRMTNGCWYENGNFYIFSATVLTGHPNPDAPEAVEFATSGRFIDG